MLALNHVEVLVLVLVLVLLQALVQLSEVTLSRASSVPFFGRAFFCRVIFVAPDIQALTHALFFSPVFQAVRRALFFNRG